MRRASIGVETGMEHGSRLLIYSHDSFGLGHLRRCRAIAQHLVERFKQLSVLILSGSPIIGSFDFRSRVDFVRVPGVIKLRNGEYTSLNLHLDIDKTLEMLKARGTRCILGLRDVMDEPASLVDEWHRKMVFPALESLYDEIWVYGLPEIFDPLSEIPGMAALADKVSFTGYLKRTVPEHADPMSEHRIPTEDFILVTPGGGGDGAELVDWVVSAYEHDAGLPHRAILLMGPFMPAEQRMAFQARVDRDPRLTAMTFEARVEPFFERASAVVAMGGYNTFCEILSFGKPALLVPRTTPRLEQYLRAERAQRLGLVRMLGNDGVRAPQRMAAALRELPLMPVPGLSVRAPMLEGLDRISSLIAPWLRPRGTLHELRRSRYA